MRRASIVAGCALLLLPIAASAQVGRRSATDFITGVNPRTVTANPIRINSRVSSPLNILRMRAPFQLPNIMTLFRRLTRTLQPAPGRTQTIFPDGFGLEDFPRTTAELPHVRIR